MPYRPLGLVREMLAGMRLTPTYAFEDLVFVEHNAFLLQFEDEGETVGMHVNTECPDPELEPLVRRAVQAGAAVGLTVVLRGRYEMRANEGEDSFSVHFL